MDGNTNNLIKLGVVAVVFSVVGFLLGCFFTVNHMPYGKSPISRDWVSPTEPEGVACTADALLCPDGSSVGRIAPNCSFAPCPGIGQ